MKNNRTYKEFTIIKEDIKQTYRGKWTIKTIFMVYLGEVKCYSLADYSLKETKKNIDNYLNLKF